MILTTTSRAFLILAALAALVFLPVYLPVEAQRQTYTETVGNSIEMVRVPEGRFTMGSPESETGRNDDEGPQHTVSVSSFFMGKYEVTQAQWRAIATRLSKVKIDLSRDPSYLKGDSLPVERVSWEDAIEFCDRLSRATGKTYRLPAEAEWEYACRAMTSGPYAGRLDEMAWYANNSGRLRVDADEIWRTDSSNYYKRILENGAQTHTVGTKQPNGYGLYDMHGNVWEWCMDYRHENYNGAPSDGSAWLSGGDTRYRVLRGGSWLNNASNCRSAVRGEKAPDTRNDPAIGFRVVVAARTP